MVWQPPRMMKIGSPHGLASTGADHELVRQIGPIRPIRPMGWRSPARIMRWRTGVFRVGGKIWLRLDLVPGLLSVSQAHRASRADAAGVGDLESLAFHELFLVFSMLL